MRRKKTAGIRVAPDTRNMEICALKKCAKTAGRIGRHVKKPGK
jgi:hypothetical protein